MTALGVGRATKAALPRFPAFAAWPSERPRGIPAAVAFVLATYGLWQVTRWGPSGDQEVIAELFYAPLGALGIGAAWRASRRAEACPRLARAWRLLGSAVLSYLLGEVLYAAFDSLGISPYPSPADILYFAFYPLFFAGVLSLLPPTRSRREQLRFSLDLVVVALGGSAALLYLMLGPVAAARGKGNLTTALSVAYPLADTILLVGMAAVVLRGSASPARRPLRLIALALCLFVAGDFIYQYQMLHAGYDSGDQVDIVWMAAIAAFALGAASQQPDDQSESARPDHLLIGWIPYAALIFGFGVVLVAQRDSGFIRGMLMPLVAMTLAGLVAIRQMLSQRDLIESQLELSHQALHDDLTGLANRTLLTDRLAHALTGRARTGEGLAVLLADLDDFKLVNDTLGHQAGDALLAEVARRMSSRLRAGETLARFGGDEFCVVAEQVETEDQAVRIAERIGAVFGAPFLLGGTSWHLSASIGIAVTNGRPSTPSDLLRDADTAMYRAKANGKGGFDLFDKRLRDRLVRRVALATALKQAADGNELELVYQPIVSLADGRIIAVETLVRWQHPSFGPVEPGEFIPLAEANGLIVPIGRFILDRAAEQAARWRNELPGLLPLGVGVNVSAAELAEPGYADFVVGTVGGHGLADGNVQLALELTERVFIDDHNPAVAANMTALARNAIRLVLDDFGSGYSALASLKRFPLQSLKIDRLFTSAIERPTDEAPVIRAVVGLGQALGLRIIAEGVETQVQLDFLRAAGAACGQGFLLGRPLPAAETGRLLAVRAVQQPSGLPGAAAWAEAGPAQRARD